MSHRSKYHFVVIGSIILATGCRNNPIASWIQKDPDSLYKGKKYTIQKPHNFPSFETKYADSLTFEGIELGRRLFYDKHLSKDGKKSCASCHFLQYALSDSGNTNSLNETGLTKRNTPSLQNLAWAKTLFWDGRLTDLAEQAKDAAHNELAINTDITVSYLKSDTTYVSFFKKAFGRASEIQEYSIDKALQQFLISIISCNSKYDRVLKQNEQFTSSEKRGLNIFSTDTGGCFRCHNSNGGYTLLFTDNNFRNNGLDSVNNVYQFTDSGRGGITHLIDDYGKFKVPSLRNVAVTGPYMHDGRFKTLQQVINFYSDSTRLSPTVDPIILFLFKGKDARHFTDQQKSDLIAFLETLTDSSFLHNPVLMDPFAGDEKKKRLP